MISDEMRELLSAYVDGELRDADAARVEEVSKRDPELRREIAAYRTLRKKLREWDAAEHGGGPASSLAARVLARARTMDAALAGRVRSGVWRPLAMAAALLLAVGAGYAIARSTAPGAPTLPEPHAGLVVKELGPAPEVELPGSALAEPAAPATVRSGMRIDDHLPSRRALELQDAMRRDELVRAKPPEPPEESWTGTAESVEVRKLLKDLTVHAAQRESLVALAQPRVLEGVPPVEPAPTGRRLGQDQSAGRIRERVVGTGDVVAPLGEVWTAEDGRTRFVAASDWIAPREDMLVRVVWGDGMAPSKTGEMLEVAGTILGPKARRRLLSAKTGSDADFLAWLKETYGAAEFQQILERDARDRERTVNKLVETLRADAAVTGFAVLDTKGKLLGVEIFHDHAALLRFAPRLLRGYLLEAGEDGIRLTPPAAATGVGTVQKLLDGMPGRSTRIEREPLDDATWGYGRAPEGLCRANLVAPSGEILGHGLLVGDTPVHLTLFGE